MTYCYPYRKGTGWRSQAFRSNPNQGANGPGGHTGFDEAMDAGTPLYAPADGIVRNSSWVGENYLDNPWWLTQMGGDILVLDCFGPDGTTNTGPTFILAHLSDSIADVGQRVRKGELIALSGNSGTATTGPHCHIEALPPNWDFNNGVYGRVDPEAYFDEWPDNYIGAQGLAAMGGTITPLDEGFLMALSDEEQRRILAAADRINYVIDDPKDKVLTTAHIEQVAASAAGKVLNTPVRRGGVGAGLGEVTSVGAVVAWFDSAVLGLAGAINSQAKASGATPDQVIDAVKQALASGVVQVDVNVTGGK